MKLTVVIVNYNVRYFLEQALRSVRKALEGIEGEVFVVDNNSVDDSVAVVREKFPEVHLIANTDNPGFSIANNQAIRQSTGEYVLLLNPDTVVEEDTFKKCIAFMDAHPQAGGLGVRMIDGSGNFLPESKRGFPSPWVAFAKTFGLSKLFPKSPLFNHYHLGYLAEEENHSVDVLAGAFMWLRRSVLDEVGLLDETFFMYGEDIDLSYRIVQGGYENYYFAEATIIHYKGESTKKGSLNYVKAFYQAMIIFARKHFSGGGAKLFVAMLQMAIYFRAALTLVSSWANRLIFPFLDASLIFSGLLLLKGFWADYHFNDPDYYSNELLYLNFPLYIGIWLTSIFFAGGYDEPFNLRRLFRGLLWGTLLLAATYGFLEVEYRSSRALIVLGAAWAFASTFILRLVLYFYRYRSFAIGRRADRRMALVGTAEEVKRALTLLQQAGVRNQVLGRVSPAANEIDILGRLDQLKEIVQVYQIDELVFCSRDVSTQRITQSMAMLGPKLLYKILPEDSSSIIGSHSKNSAGELYTVDIAFAIDEPLQRRNKRLFDLLLSVFLLLSLPLQLLLISSPLQLLRNLINVLVGKSTWVGYAKAAQPKMPNYLPKLRQGVLTPLDALQTDKLKDAATIDRLNMLYAKDYRWGEDLRIVWRAWKNLGQNVVLKEY